MCNLLQREFLGNLFKQIILFLIINVDAFEKYFNLRTLKIVV